MPWADQHHPNPSGEGRHRLLRDLVLLIAAGVVVSLLASRWPDPFRWVVQIQGGLTVAATVIVAAAYLHQYGQGFRGPRPRHVITVSIGTTLLGLLAVAEIHARLGAGGLTYRSPVAWLAFLFIDYGIIHIFIHLTRRDVRRRAFFDAMEDAESGPPPGPDQKEP